MAFFEELRTLNPLELGVALSVVMGKTELNPDGKVVVASGELDQYPAISVISMAIGNALAREEFDLDSQTLAAYEAGAAIFAHVLSTYAQRQETETPPPESPDFPDAA